LSRFTRRSSAVVDRKVRRAEQAIAEPEELGNGGRIQWVSDYPGEAPAYAGTDFIIVRDDRIAAVHLFSTRYPELPPMPELRGSCRHRAENVSRSQTLVRLTVDFGDHRRRIMAGLKPERARVEGRTELLVIDAL
jgi:hypothetical protein